MSFPGAIGDEVSLMKKWIIAATAVVMFLAAAAAAHFILFTVPYRQAETYMPQGGARLFRNGDGTMTLTWPSAVNADDYLVEFQIGEVSFWTIREGTSCLMPETVMGTGKMTVTVTPRKRYKTPRGTYTRLCSQPLRATYPAALPSLDSLKTYLDPDADTLTLRWDPVDGGVYTVTDQYGSELFRTDGGEAVIAFGKDVPMPSKDENVTFTVTCGLEGFGVEYSSQVSATVEASGEELRGTKLIMDTEELGNNRFRFTWNETKGERYELQLRKKSGEWQTVREYGDTDELTCTLGPLDAFADYEVRVIALGGTTLPGSEYAATPSETSFTTGPSVKYATIWAMQDLDVWSDTAKSQKVGTATTDRAYCVVDEAEGFFLIYLDGAKGYIDSRYCLINLPDYLGDLVAYDITNSYDSIYMVHDYGIPKITNTVITGYEEVASGSTTEIEMRTVRQDVDENGNHIDIPDWVDLYTTVGVSVEKPTDFLVPLLYPTAQKVLKAALAAREDGYRLKIYDAFRPGAATRFLYDMTLSLIDNEIPEHEYSDMAGDMWMDYYYSLFPDERPAAPEPEPEDGSTEDPGSGEDVPPEDTEPGEETPPDDPGSGESADTPEEGGEGGQGGGTQSQGTVIPSGNGSGSGPRPSFYTLMTDGRYRLGNFLAQSGSYHNFGLAVDLTLEEIDTGRELLMQTAIHDLSWYSVLSENNDNANLLASYMTGADLNTLVSEWWHFQDNETDRSLRDLKQRWNGVTRAGWVADDNGWRYRTHENEFLTSGTYEVDGRTYTFDENGYSDYAAWEN